MDLAGISGNAPTIYLLYIYI